MAKEYSLGGDGLTLANQPVTLVGILPATAVTPMLNILRMWASQAGSATSAQQRIQAVAQPSGYPTVATATPRNLKRSDTVASLIVGVAGALTAGKCGINASAEGTGTKVVMFGDNFNVLNGYLWVATPREVVELAGSDTSSFGLFLPAAPSSLSNWACGVNYGEGS